jgi:hypothetical protein
MKGIITLNYYNKLKSILPEEEFITIEKLISNDSNEQLEAFWNLVVAGYSVEFALENYKMLYDFIKDKPIDYSESLITYVTYPKIDKGIFLEKTKWFELN